MVHRFFRGWLAVAIVALPACDVGDGPRVAWIQAMHAVSDAPALRTTTNDVIFSPSLGYESASGWSVEALPGGSTHEVSFTARPLQPDDQTSATLVEERVTLRENRVTTVVMTGTVDDHRTIVVDSPRRTRPIALLFFQFAQAVPALGPLDVYVTGPNVPLSSTAPFANLEPGGQSESLRVSSGERRIRFTRSGTLEVLFDSGTLTFQDDPNSDSDGAEWLFAAVDDPGSGTAPLRLLASNGLQSTVINDRDTPASLRVFHAAADAPAVDVVLGDDFSAPLATGLAYEGRSPTLPLPPGTANLNFPATGTTTELVVEEQIETRIAQRYDLFMVGADSGTDAVVAQPDPRSVTTQARIRMVNAAPRSELFSGYLSTAAAGSQDPEDRVFLDVAFRTITPYFAVAAGSYQLVLTERPVATSDVEETVTIGPVALELADGDVVTLLILPPDDGTEVEKLQTWDDTAP